MTKGDIVWAKDRDMNPHPIVFLERIDDYCFKACILSTKPTNGNVLMQRSHFKNDIHYSVKFRNTYLVTTCTFIKMSKWIEKGNVVGRLTDEGIEL
jgi:hypothetical protein